jgi:hypothetical protein
MSNEEGYSWVTALVASPRICLYVSMQLQCKLPDFCTLLVLTADHGGRAVWSMNCLRPLEHWGPGFESHSRHGYLCAFILCAVLCVGSGLATGWSPAQGILPTVYRIKKVKKRPRSNKRTVEPFITVDLRLRGTMHIVVIRVISVISPNFMLISGIRIWIFIFDVLN